jgi:hypothetical protein
VRIGGLPLGIVAVALVAAAADCNVDRTVDACERLRHYSCDCFSICQTGDKDAIDSNDGARCDAQLRADFDTWSVCASGVRENGQRCDASCDEAWGACAFDAFERAGLAPHDACGEGASDGGGLGG